MPRRAERIFKTMDWELQARFEHISDEVLMGPSYIEAILKVLDTLAGEKQASEKRRTVRKALFEGVRRQDESLAQFTLRREQEFAMAEKYMTIPEDLKAFMLEENAALGKQGTMNLRTLTAGAEDFSSVAKALRILDMDEEGLSTRGKSSNFVGIETGDPEAKPAFSEAVESESSSEDEQAIFAEIEKLDLSESDALEIYVAMEHEKRTWKENKKLKLARKKDRRHFADKGEKSERAGSSLERIKRISRCGNCGEKGHWAEDCTKPYRSKADRLIQEAKKKSEKGTPSKTAFVFLGHDQDASVLGHSFFEGDVSFSGAVLPSYAEKVLQRFREKTSAGTAASQTADTFVSLRPGHAIIDPGAGQDLIGHRAYLRLVEKLKEVQIQPVQIDEKPEEASGVGGKATTLFKSLVPCVLGGVPGIVKLTVVKEDIPHLLSIGLLESAGAVINTKTNEIHYENFGAKDVMSRLSTGHRTIDVTLWDGSGSFPVPEELREQYGLLPGAFDRKPSEGGAYMARSSGVADHWEHPEGMQAVLRVHHEPRTHTFSRVEDLDERHVPQDLSLRLTVAFVDGTILWDLGHSETSVRLGDQTWTGVSLFFSDSNDAAKSLKKEVTVDSHGEPPGMCLEPTGNSLGGEGASAAGARGEESHLSHAGKRLNGNSHGSLSSSNGVRCDRSESIRFLDEVPALQDQAQLHPTHREAGVSTKRQEDSCDVCSSSGHGGKQPGEGIKDPGEEVGDQLLQSASDTGAIDSGTDQHPHGEQSAASGRHDAVAHAGSDPGAAEPTASDRDSTAAGGRAGYGAPEYVGITDRHDGDHAEFDSPDAGISELRGLGDDAPVGGPEAVGGAAAVITSTPTRAFRASRALGDEAIREIDPSGKVAWASSFFEDYLASEDLSDDYEAGIPGNVKRAARKMLATYEQPVTRTFCPYKVVELFSPPRVTPVCEAQGLATCENPAWDLDTGWDFFSPSGRRDLWKMLQQEEPDLVIMTPECRAFSQIMEINWERLDSAEAQRIQAQGLAMFQVCVQVADFQLSHGKHFLIEHPDGASSWRTESMRWLLSQVGVQRVRFDQCQFGLKPDGEHPARKRTAFASNHPGILLAFRGHFCPGLHEHIHLEGGNLTARARIWPEELIQSVVKGILGEVRYRQSFFDEDTGEARAEDLDAEETRVDAEVEVPEEPSASIQELSSQQKEMIHRLHVNLGHLPLDRFIPMLKAAKARPEVLDYVHKQFRCDVCMNQRREISRRKAAYPRTFEFNRIIGLDTFFVKWGDKTLPFLNIVDHGSNWQTVCLVRPRGNRREEPSSGNPTSADTWHHFLKFWVQPHGIPEAAITDGGMEFRDRFERGLEQLGTLQTVTDQESPWQNGRVERHGQWVKERLELELSGGTSVLGNVDDLEELAMALVTTKNSWFNRGGYSPAQLVYGKNPRLPTELLSDAGRSTPGRDDVLCDPGSLDTAAEEFRRSHSIREAARRLSMQHTAKEKLREASKPPLHKHRTWTAGQWVMVWRLSKHATTRHRWVGPGLVILQNGHTVYVAMRSRLWKCNSDQLRPASDTEDLAMQVVMSDQYRQLLQQLQQQRHGAVDVAREGTPEPEAWRSCEVRREEAPTLDIPLPPGAIPSGTPAPSPPLEHAYHPIRTPSITGSRDLGGLRSGPRSEDTTSEPFAEPDSRERSDLGRPDFSSEAHRVADDHKRRRLMETISEEPASASAPSQDPAGTAVSVPERVQRYQDELMPSLRPTIASEIRDAPRRRSRSPLPEVLRRQRVSRGPIEESQDVQPEAFVQSLETSAEFKRSSILFNSLEDAGAVSEVSNVWISPEAGSYVVEAPRNGEITWSQMDGEEERQKFREADLAEWKSLEDEFKAVKVWRGEEAKKLREQFRDRIMSCRIVRRRKPMPGLHQYKAKSRFCVHGHKDPDGGTFRTFSPTPSTEALHIVCQIAANRKMRLVFGDVKAAFAQSDLLKRPRGRLFCQPCEGCPLEAQDLIEIVAPVYGLDDAPLRWHETVSSHLLSYGYVRSLLDPSIFMLFADSEGQAERQKHLLSVVLVEVDDFMIASDCADTESKVKELLTQRFKFGKWEQSEADYIGRHITLTEKGEIWLDQEKYIVEKIQPLTIGKGRRACKEDPLTAAEFSEYRSMLYKISWVAHQTRPEVSGAVSLLASRMHQACVQDMILLNKMAGHLRDTAKQPLRIRPFSDDMVFIGVSDAGGVDGDIRGTGPDGLIEDPVQGAWLVLASSMMPAHDRKIPVSLLSWRSSKLKRRVTSTMAGETLALSQCTAEIEWLQIFYRDVMFNDVNTANWQRSLSPFVAMLPERCSLCDRQPQCQVTDAKSLYDALYKKCPSSRQDRRNALELAVVVDVMRKTGSDIRWTPHQRMPVDMLTKSDITASNGALLHLIKTATLRIDREDEELLRRQKDRAARSRTRRATERLLDEETEEFFVALSSIVCQQEFGEL